MLTRPNLSPLAPSAAPPSSGAPSRDLSPEVVVNDVFLSPRVVDRRAFSELSGELKEIVERAAIERGAMIAALDQAGKSLQDLRSREQTQQVNLELALRALKSIEDKSARVEELLVRASDTAKLFEAIDAKAESLVSAKLGVIEARLEALTAGATAKAEALEERIRRAGRELEQRVEAIRRDAQQITAPVHDGLLTLCERATLLASAQPGRGGLGELIAQGEKLRIDAERVIESLDKAHTHATESKLQTDEWIASAGTRLDQLAQRRAAIDADAQAIMMQMDRNLEIIRAGARGTQLDAADRAQQAIDTAQASINALEARARTLRADAETTLSDLAPKAEIAAQALRDTIKQSHDAHNTTALAMRVLERTQGQVQGLLTKLEPWKGMLDENADAVPPMVRKMLDNVRGELSSVAGALRGAADRVDRAGDCPAI
ncbi:MAG: hypothetical protein K2W85_10245 [Phycisphaerales bacterium]|nr:hypothetical protein [Phycisphaerales bacterium]